VLPTLRSPRVEIEILTDISGIYMIAIAPAASSSVTGGARAALFATVVGPVLLTALLMFVSGLTLSERPGAKRRYEAGRNWEAYERYLRRTSILIPFPPQLYEPLPTLIKRTLFLEFPIYVFDPAKHSGRAKPHHSVGEGRRTDEEERGSGDDLVAGGQRRQSR